MKHYYTNPIKDPKIKEHFTVIHNIGVTLPFVHSTIVEMNAANELFLDPEFMSKEIIDGSLVGLGGLTELELYTLRKDDIRLERIVNAYRNFITDAKDANIFPNPKKAYLLAGGGEKANDTCCDDTGSNCPDYVGYFCEKVFTCSAASDECPGNIEKSE